MIVDKDYRITLPKNTFTSFSVDDFVEVTISKGNLKASFYTRVPRKYPSRKYLQVRRKLSKDIIKYLQIMPLDRLKLIEAKKINKIAAESFKDDYFDLLSLDLVGLMAKLFSKDSQDWISFWKSSKNGGVTNPIELKRFIPINKKIGEFFGLMQAESSKRGNKFDFINIFLSEHKIFLETAEQLGISRSKWTTGIIYKPTISETDILNAKKLFLRELGLEDKCYVTKSQTITKFAYQISIGSTILNKVMNTALKKLRREIIPLTNKNQNYKEFCRGFLLKVLLGDGTVTRPSSQNMQIVITEPDKEAQNDLVKICKLFNITTNISGIRIYLSTDFESVVWYLQNGAFLGHEKNRRKIEDYVRRNYFFKILEERLKTINSKIDSKRFAKVNGIKLAAAKRYLERCYVRGYVKKEKKRNRNFYEINLKGKEFLKMMATLR